MAEVFAGARESMLARSGESWQACPASGGMASRRTMWANNEHVIPNMRERVPWLFDRRVVRHSTRRIGAHAVPEYTTLPNAP